MTNVSAGAGAGVPADNVDRPRELTRDEANTVFALVSEIHGELKDRLVASRWWLIWLIMGPMTLLTSVVSHVLLETMTGKTWPHVAVWSIHLAASLLVVRLVHRRTGGVRTAREQLLWIIWTAFLAAACSIAPLNDALGMETMAMLPVAAVMAAFACVVTAAGVHRMFWFGAPVFTAAAVAMVGAPGVRFLIFGAAWLIVLATAGVMLRSGTKARTL